MIKAGKMSLILIWLAIAMMAPGPEMLAVDDKRSSRVNGMQNQTHDLKPGVWGGRGISLTVEKNSAAIELDCAKAEISARLRTRKDGKFTASGLLTRSGPGPVRLDALPKPQPVRFEGKVTGKRMSLKITLVDSGDVIGNYVLERGTKGALIRCY